MPGSRRKFSYVGADIPDSDGLEVGDRWIDTSGALPVAKICSSLDPVTFIAAGDGGDGTTLIVAETEVYNGEDKTDWAELDLSGAIGANPAIVLLKVDHTDTGMNRTIAVRKKGDTDEFYKVSYSRGCAVADVYGGIPAVLIVATSDTGVIEWKSEFMGNNTVMIDTIAYVK